MPTDHIMSLLIAERDMINHAIEALRGTHTAAAPTQPKKKRHISGAVRRRMALGQKRRWAALKAAKG
jgi:hypothetical protein